jgi:heme exporter protein C
MTTAQRIEPPRRSLPLMALLAGLGLAVGGALLLWGGLVHPPTERVMGDVQRIFYFHVPAAMNAALAYLVAAVAGIGFLVTRRETWDRLGRASVETGTLFATIVLITGPIWARPAWGVWWTWEPRLTTTLIAWLIFLGAIVVRRIANDPEQAARLAAVIAIVGFLDLPIVYMSVEWWGGHHPIVISRGGGGISPAMRAGLWGGLAGVFLIHASLFALRWRLATAEDAVAAAERRADEQGGLR